MRGKRLAAVELLLSYPEAVVAEMLGVRLQTVTRWMVEADFADALGSRERQQSRSLARIARHAAVRAASALCQIAGDCSKPDPKALLEILKASGAFEGEQSDPAEALREIVRMAGQAAEVSGEPQDN